MGYNVHIIDSVGEDWQDYTKQLDQLQKEGVRRVRSDSISARSAKPTALWIFSEPDAFFAEAQKRGIHVLPVMIASNNHIPEDFMPVHKNLDKLKDYLKRFCGRYKDIVNCYQISNEPDGSNIGSTLTECNDPAVYIQILSTAYRTIKEVAPDAVIVAVAPTRKSGYAAAVQRKTRRRL